MRKKLSNSVVPYHLFNVKGENFIFDTTNCRFYQIDEISANFLSLALNYPLPNVKSILRKTKNFPSSDLEHIYKKCYS